jgi:hypothetical protein
MHTACVIPPSSALAFGMEMSEKLKPISPTAMQRKNQQKTISVEEKLYLISQHEKGEQIVDIHHNVRFLHICICTIHDMLKELQKVLSPEIKCLCTKTTMVLSE